MIKFKQSGAGNPQLRPTCIIGGFLPFLLFLLASMILFYSGYSLGGEGAGEGRNIIFVLDTSGSMKDKFAGVKNAFATLTDGEAKDGDTISVIAFDTTSRLVASRQIKGQSDRDDLKNAVNGLNPIGQFTYIAGALRSARQEMERLSAAAPEKESRIIVLTDGKNEVPPSIPASDVVDLKDEANKISQEAGWAIYYVVLVKKKTGTGSTGEQGGSQAAPGGEGAASTGTGPAGEGEISPELAQEFPGGKLLMVESTEGEIAAGLKTTVAEPLAKPGASSQGTSKAPEGVGGRIRGLAAQYPVALPVGAVVVLAVVGGLVFVGLKVRPASGGRAAGRRAGAGKPQEISFEVAQGVKKGQVYQYNIRPGEEITVGSGGDCQVPLKEEKVAEKAFKVKRTANGGYTLSPIATNIEVNNSLIVKESPLKSMDKVHVGGCHLVFKEASA